jgi:hypothetical protein
MIAKFALLGIFSSTVNVNLLSYLQERIPNGDILKRRYRKLSEIW